MFNTIVETKAGVALQSETTEPPQELKRKNKHLFNPRIYKMTLRELKENY